ncbi:Uncharacterized protein HZ326_15213 [Fusarium oxysporum f. sp. albedinis]|nr:Uncharacterized protein HZ326_15213 [Fusarium oxysporum f. sp. albedinis]
MVEWLLSVSIAGNMPPHAPGRLLLLLGLAALSTGLTPYALKYLYVVVPISTSPIKMKRQWLAYCKVETSTSSVDISGSCSFKRVRYRVDALDKRSASMLLFFG